MDNQENKQQILMMRTGTCRFCGQSIVVETCGGLSEDMLMEFATEKCNCVDAKAERKKNKQIETTYDNIHQIMGQGGAADVMVSAVIPVYKGEIDSVSVNIGNGTRVTLQMTGDGKAKLTRVRSIKDSLES